MVKAPQITRKIIDGYIWPTSSILWIPGTIMIFLIISRGYPTKTAVAMIVIHRYAKRRIKTWILFNNIFEALFIYPHVILSKEKIKMR